MKQSTKLAGIVLGASLPGLMPSPASAAGCISEAEVEAAVGAELRAGVFAIRTDKLGDRPLCSGLTMAQTLQKLRQAYDRRAPHSPAQPQEAPRAEASQAPNPQDEKGSWSFSIDPANAEYSASARATAIMKYGVEVSLFIDCSVSTIGMTLGYESHEETLPEPRRSVVHDYARAIYADPPVLHILQRGSETGRFTWDIYEGGSATITPARMRLLLAADQLRVTGGSEPMSFSTRNLPQAVAGVMRQCRFRS